MRKIGKLLSMISLYVADIECFQQGKVLTSCVYFLAYKGVISTSAVNALTIEQARTVNFSKKMALPTVDSNAIMVSVPRASSLMTILLGLVHFLPS